MTFTTISSDILSGFAKKILKKIQKLIMTVVDKIRDEKLHHAITREAA